MGRPARHEEAKILECARQLSAETGPRSLTIAAIAERAGAPVGSIYYRHASRDEILATIWLDLVEEFQRRFLAALGAEADAVEAGLAAVAFTCDWVRGHPVEARLLLLHRREDFASDRWSPQHRERAEALAERSAAGLRRYALRLAGRGGPAQLRGVRFALVDVPAAALRRDIEAGAGPSKDVEDLLADTCAFALRRIAAAGARGARGSSTKPGAARKRG